MLAYEESRTETIVNKFLKIGDIIKFIIIVVSIVQFAGIAAMIGLQFFGEAVGPAILGGIAGYLIGNFIAALILILLEWYSQILVVLENILYNQTKK